MRSTRLLLGIGMLAYQIFAAQGHSAAIYRLATLRRPSEGSPQVTLWLMVESDLPD